MKLKCKWENPKKSRSPPGNADLKGSGSKRRSSSAKTNGQQRPDRESSHQRKTSSSNKKSLRWQARRFRTEAKATKTVGSIVGAFICCWLPFFTVYLVKAFCETCIHDIVFGKCVCSKSIRPSVPFLAFYKGFLLNSRMIVCDLE